MAEASRVHFDAGQVQEVHNSEIVVQYTDADKIQVHLGFLQINHHYEVTFSVKDKLSEDLLADSLQNLNVKVANIMPTEDGEGHEFKIDLFAHKEKLMREQLVVTDSTDPSLSLTLVLNARVLGKGKGKPSLLNGIHCSGVNMEEDSEQSDWQGFD